MIEVQFISKVLEDGSLFLARQHNVDPDHFISFKTEFEFILDHHQQFGNVPDRETFLSKFPDFDFVSVKETDRYLVETLKEQFFYTRMVPFVNEVASKLKVDAREAIDFIRSKMPELTAMSTTFQSGKDIIKNAEDRAREFKKRQEMKGLLGITTGIKELDDITHGWLKGEDFIVIQGRTNEGKTWVMLFFLVAAWMSGVPVLLYSGEMSDMMIGFRFDTFVAHFSNEGLMHGATELGKEGSPKTTDDYFDYCKNLSTNEVPFVVVTPKDLGGQRLTIPVLHQLIEHYKSGIVGVDQLSLMDDYRATKGQQDRTRFTHIAEDLYLTSEKYGIPVLSPAQSNRESAKDSDKEKESDKVPELHHIAESDGVPQNATRVISIKKIGVTMKLGMKKNRYGKVNQEILVIWDIDKGIVKPFLQVSNTAGQTTTQPTKGSTGGEDLF